MTLRQTGDLRHSRLRSLVVGLGMGTNRSMGLYVDAGLKGGNVSKETGGGSVLAIRLWLLGFGLIGLLP